MPGRITPRTQIGGQEQTQRQIMKSMSGLGTIIGLIIFGGTALLIAVDTLLNPIFLFAQARASGIDIGTPFGNGWLAWWTVGLITLCTTGIQYAFFDPGSKGWGIGRIVGIIIMAMDTAMDGGGFLAWQASGSHLTNLTGDATHLRWGMFPAVGSSGGEWFVWGVICATCAFHELFLGKVLGMVTFKPSVQADAMNVKIALWVYRAGQLLNSIRLVALSFTPYIMLGLDVVLFPQSQRAKDGGTQFGWIIVTAFVTILTLMLWRYYNDLHVEGGYKILQLDRTHQFMFFAAVAMSTIDSAYDLKGFNEAVYHQSGWVPQNLPAGGIQQWMLTAGIVMLICTAFAPMYSQLFGPVAMAAALIPGYSTFSPGGDPFGGGGGGFGGRATVDPFAGSDPFGGGGPLPGGVEEDDM